MWLSPWSLTLSLNFQDLSTKYLATNSPQGLMQSPSLALWAF